MREVVDRLHEKKQIELAKSILENAGYKVEKRVNEDTLIAVCKYGPDNEEEVYARETEDGYWKWYDSMGESDDDFDSPEDAVEAFIDFMETESPDTPIRKMI